MSLNMCCIFVQFCCTEFLLSTFVEMFSTNYLGAVYDVMMEVMWNGNAVYRCSFGFAFIFRCCSKLYTTTTTRLTPPLGVGNVLKSSSHGYSKTSRIKVADRLDWTMKGRELMGTNEAKWNGQKNRCNQNDSEKNIYMKQHLWRECITSTLEYKVINRKVFTFEIYSICLYDAQQQKLFFPLIHLWWI